MTKIKPSPTIAMSNKAKELKQNGVNVYDFTVGEPDFQTPKHIIDAAYEGMLKGNTKYTLINGTLDLRKAICEKLANENQLEYDPSEIVASTGAKQAIFNTMAATLNHDDEVIIQSPAWVSYFDIVKIFGGVPVSIKTTMEEGFILSAEKLEQKITNKTKWIMLNSPSNPTGIVYTKEQLESLAEVLRKYPHVNIMCDDIYEHMIFDNQKFYTMANVAPDLINRIAIINGVSKSYSMTGFRLGYLASKNKDLVKAVTTIQSQSTSSTSSVSQYAGAFALRSEDSKTFISTMKQEMQKRRDFVHQAINEISGLKSIKGSGAFYAFISIDSLIGRKFPNGNTITSGIDFCEHLLSEVFVATVPGEAFDLENHFRFSFSTDINTIKEGIEKIKIFVNNLSK